MNTNRPRPRFGLPAFIGLFFLLGAVGVVYFWDFGQPPTAPPSGDSLRGPAVSLPARLPASVGASHSASLRPPDAPRIVILPTDAQPAPQSPVPALRTGRVDLVAADISENFPNVGDRIDIEFFDDAAVSAEVKNVTRGRDGTVSLTAGAAGSRFGRIFLSQTAGRLMIVANLPEQNRQFRVLYDETTKTHFAIEVDMARLVQDDEGAHPVAPANAPTVPNFERLIPPELHPGTAAGGEPQPTLQTIIAQADEAGGGAAPSGEPDIMADPPANIVVDLMLVYTPAARVAAGSLANLQNAMALAVEEANDVHANNQSGIELRLVHSAETTYTESGDESLSDELSRITSTSDGHMDDIHALRNQYKADLVQLVCNENGGGGIAWLLNTTAGSPTYGFSVTNYDSLVGILTPVHEIGHNMGLHHAIDQNYQPGPGIFSDSGGWHWHPSPGQTGFCTVMTYTSGTYFADGLSHSRVPYFSDPYETIDGYATGHETEANNVRALRLLKRIYAEYRTGENFFPVININDGLAARPQVQTTITAADLQASDANGSDTPTVLTFTIVTPPAKGVLKKNSTTLGASSTFTQKDIDDGLISYTSSAGQTGADSLVFHLRDSQSSGPENVAFAIEIDSVPPAVTALSPANGSGVAGVSDNLVLTFSETIRKGASGTITIRRLSNNALVETIDITVATVAGAVLTINPSATLDFNTAYYIEIPSSGTILDRAGNPFTGFTGSSTWSFSTTTQIGSLALAPVASPQTATVPIPVSITAKNPAGATDTAFSGAGKRAALSAYRSEIVSLGSGTASAAAFLSTAEQEHREEVIYYQSELGAGAVIYGISVNVKTAPSPGELTNFTVRLAHTTKTTFATTSVANADLVTCWTGNFSVSTTGWVDIPFTNPFAYNGSDNLIVSFSHDNPANGTSGWVYTYASSANRRLFKGNTDGSAGDPLYWSTLQSVSANLPQIRFKTRGASIPVSPSLTGDFSSGVWSGNVTLQESAPGAVIFATVAGISGGSNLFAVQEAPSTPNIQISGNGTVIGNGSVSASVADHSAFGAAAFSGGSVVRTFTIANPGVLPLVLGTPPVSISGANAGEFSVVSQPASTVPAGGSTTFQIAFQPTSAGLRSATVSVATNVPGLETYTFAIHGLATRPGITAASWNAYKNLDLPATRSAIRTMGADVLLLTEVNSEVLIDTLIAELQSDTGFTYYKYYPSPQQDPAYPLAFISRYPITGAEDWSVVAIDASNRIAKSVPKISVTVDGETFHFVGFHARTASAHSTHATESDTLRALLASRLANQRVIALGDFNSRAASDGARTDLTDPNYAADGYAYPTTYSTDGMLATGFRDAFRTVNPTRPAPATKLYKPDGTIGSNAHERIDFTFVSPDLTILDAGVAADTSNALSDHKPAWVRIGTASGTAQTGGASAEPAGPRIVSSTLAADNSYLDVLFDTGVYAAPGASGALTPAHFEITFEKHSDGFADAVAIGSVAHAPGSASARIFLGVTGTPNGFERIRVHLAGGNLPAQNKPPLHVYAADGTPDLWTRTVNGTPVAGDQTTNRHRLNPPSTWLVSSSADSGAGSLRAVLQSCSENATVAFAPGVTAITLSSGELAIGKSVTVDGGGNVTLSGNNASRIFSTSGSGKTILLRGLTLTNGRREVVNADAEGGALYNAGASLVLERCTVRNSVALTTGASLTTRNGEGGGIFQLSGNLTLSESSIENNLANSTGGNSTMQSYGGGIHLEGGNLTILRSTIAGNTATGGTLNASDGGGLYLVGAGVVSIVNSTISGNSADDMGGGIYVDDKTMDIFNSTITSNISVVGNDGGGIHVLDPAIVRISSTIVSANTGPDLETASATAPTLSHSLYGTFTGTISPTTCIVSSAPQLSTLANNGGLTRTHALLEGSAAIDAGSTAAAQSAGWAIDFDQRGAGFVRVSGVACDIGAFEFGQPSALPYESWLDSRGLDEVTGAPGADPDGNGLVNLLEYALNAGAGAPAYGVLPVSTSDGTNLAISYRRNVDATDLIYTVQSSPDLVIWTDETAGTKSATLDADTEQWGFSKPLGGQRLFLRLKVEFAP